MTRNLKILTIITLTILSSCKKEDASVTNPQNNDEEIVTSNSNVEVNIPQELQNEEIIIITNNSDFEISEEINIDYNIDSKQFVFVNNSKGEILLASPGYSGKTLISYDSTAETLISMMPWTGYLTVLELQNIMREIKAKDEYSLLVQEIEKVVKENISPLSNSKCLELLNQINSDIFNNSDSNKSLKSLTGNRIPDVDFLVEPILSYNNDKITIKNDGLTTATWGVQFLNADGNSISDYLMLKGNEFNLPDLSSLFNFFVNDEPFGLIELSDPIEFNITSGAKYQIDFKSPTSSTILQGKLAYNAAKYNVYYNYSVFLDAFGIELPKIPTINPSAFFDSKDCAKDLFGIPIDKAIIAINKDEFDDDFIFDSIKSIFKESLSLIANCTELGGKISNTTYVKNISKFLDVYSKLESAFKIGKFIGDMAVLSDINICRHFIQGNMHSCFKLEKNTNQFFEDQIYCSETEIALTVKTVLENIIPNENTYPINLEVTWEYVNPDGQITTSTSKVNSEGIAEFYYTTTDDDNQSVKAFIKNKDLTVDKVGFNLKVDKAKLECIENPLIGTWESAFIPVSLKTVQGEYTNNNCPNSIFSEYNIISEKYKLVFSENGELCIYAKSRVNELNKNTTSLTCEETFNSSIIERDYEPDTACFMYTYNETNNELVITPSNQGGIDSLDGADKATLFLTIVNNSSIDVNNPLTTALDLWDGKISFIKQ